MELILLAMISLIVIVALLASRLNDNSFPFPFDSKSVVFTPAEKNFQNLVEQALGPKYRILNRVKLSDIVAIRNGISKRASQIAVKNANSKFVDFAICERNSMKLLGAIDLVDTQGKGYKVKKDWFVSGALDASAIPHIRIKVKTNYTLDEIRACINSRILGTSSPVPKMRGRVIPAAMIKARPRNIEDMPAAVPQLARNTGGQMASLSH
jgi:hypothetical protein